jgi:hypothetical protein
MRACHVVCRECGARWTAANQPRSCKTSKCEAGWLDLPMFAAVLDADRAAAKFAEERAGTRPRPSGIFA